MPVWSRGRLTFSVKVERLSILDFVSHKVSAVTPQLLCMQAARQHTQELVWLCPLELHYIKHGALTGRSKNWKSKLRMTVLAFVSPGLQSSLYFISVISCQGVMFDTD